MREIRTSGSEVGGDPRVSPYPYHEARPPWCATHTPFDFGEERSRALLCLLGRMERSLQTIRTLRIVLPILFVAFILVIIAFYTERSGSTGDEITTTARPEREGEQPRLISYEFEDTQTIGDRVISRIRAEKTVGFDSGWYTLDNVELDIFRQNGGVYTLTAPSAEFNAESKEARAEGGVIVTSGDGLDLRTEAIVFDGRRLTNRVPVRFRMN